MNFIPSNSNLVNNDETGCRQTNSFKTKAKRIVLMNLLASRYKNHAGFFFAKKKKSTRKIKRLK